MRVRSLLGLHRFASLPSQASDADLLLRFRVEGDANAFESLLQRHGPMVYAVCQHRLREPADVEDAFQAVFVVLARATTPITNLAGWLYRVAYLVSLKAAGRRAGRTMQALPDDVPHDAPDATQRIVDVDLREVIEAEIAELPEKLRAVVALCLVQGRTNTEAAQTLGIPVGTVDSRLSNARKTLQARLTRRGVALGTVLAFELILVSPTTAAALHDLFTRTTQLITELISTSATAVPPLVEELTRGLTTMTLTKTKLLAVLGMSVCLLGGTGYGIFSVTADDKPKTADVKPPVAADKKPSPKSPVPPELKPTSETTGTALKGATHTTTATLDEPFEINSLDQMTVETVLLELSKKTGLTHRLDSRLVNELSELGEAKPYEKKLTTKITANFTVRDVLDEIVELFESTARTANNSAAPIKIGIVVRGKQVILTRGFVPPVVPGRASGPDGATPLVDEKTIAEMLYGPIVSVAVKNMPLSEFIDYLREKTGANIVLSDSNDVTNAHRITLTLNDTRLLTVLKVAGLTCPNPLAPANIDNVFCLMEANKARETQMEVYRELFGEAKPPNLPFGGAGEGLIRPAK